MMQPRLVLGFRKRQKSIMQENGTKIPSVYDIIPPMFRLPNNSGTASSNRFNKNGNNNISISAKTNKPRADIVHPVAILVADRETVQYKKPPITTTSIDGNSNSKLFEVKSASANGVVINANQDAGATSTTTKENNTSGSGENLAENSETTTTIETANTKDKQCSTVAGEAVDTPIMNNYAARRSLNTRSNTPILSREILALQRSVNASKVLTEFVTETAISKDRSLRKVKDDGLNRRDSSLFFSDDSCSDDNGEILPQQAQEEEQYFPNTEHNPQPMRKKRKSIHYKSSPEQKLKQPRQLVSIEQMKKIRYARRSRSQCSIRTYDVLRKDPKNHDFDLNANQGLKMKRPPLEADIGGAKACNSDVEYDKTAALMGVDDDGGSSTITYNHLNASFNDSELVARGDGSIEDATDTTTQAELLDRKLQLSWNPPPKEGADAYCWKCHESNTQVVCSKCPRSYHLSCTKISKYDTKNNLQTFICPDCSLIENILNGPKKNRSSSLSLEILNQLLSFVLKRMRNVKGHLNCFQAMNSFENKSKYLRNHVTFDTLQEKIDRKEFRCTDEFIIEAKWIVHNALILYVPGSNNKDVISAKTVLKCCRQEANEIETCAECYLNANTRADWFTQVCAQPHLILWAKLKGFPYWPAKFMGPGQGLCVNVRFFGEHDRAFVPIKDCYLYSEEAPNTQTVKRTARELTDCIKEVNVHIDHIRAKIGNFRHAPVKTAFDPNHELKHLEFMMPGVMEYMKRQNGLQLKPSLQFKIVKVAGNTMTYIKKAGDVGRTELASNSSSSSKKKHVDDDSNTILNSKYEVVSTSNTKDDDNSAAKKVSVILKRKSPAESESHEMAALTSKSDKIDNNGHNNHHKNNNNSDKNINHNDNGKKKRQNFEVATHTDDSSLAKRIQGKKPLLTNNTSTLVDRGTMENSMLNRQNETIARLREALKLSKESIKPIASMQNKRSSVESITSGSVDDTTNKNTEVSKKVVKPLIPFVEVKSEPISGDEMNDFRDSFTLIPENPFENVDTTQGTTTTNTITTITTTDPLRNSPTAKEPVQSSTSEINETEAIAIPKDNPLILMAAATAPTLENFLSEAVTETVEQHKELQVEQMNTEPITPPPASPPPLNQIQENITNNEPAEERQLAPDEIKTEILSDVEDNDMHRDDERISQDSENQVNNEIRTIGGTTIQRISKSKKRKHHQSSKRQLGKKYKGILSSSPLSLLYKRQIMEKNVGQSLFKSQRARKTFPNHSSGPRKHSTPTTATPTLLTPPTCTIIITTTTTSPSISPINVISTISNATTISAASSSSMSSKKSSPSLIVNQKNNALKLATSMVSIPAHYVNNQCDDGKSKNMTIPVSPLMAVYKSQLNNEKQNDVNDRFSVATTSSTDITNSLSSTTTTLPNLTTTTSLSTINTTPTFITTTPTTAIASSNISNKTTTIGAPTSIACTLTTNAETPTAETISQDNDNNSTPADHLLHSTVTPTMASAITDLLCRGPPPLAPRPTGPFSSDGSIMFPSQAGPVSQIISSSAHKLTDFFISVIQNSLDEISVGDEVGNLQAKVTTLQLQLERQKFTYEQQINEIKRNSDVLLSEMRKSMEAETTRIATEVRRQCAIERQRSIEETKKKQWCANCGIEAHFYCCWNTTYCDFPCQSAHWQTHASRCGQAIRVQQQMQQQQQFPDTRDIQERFHQQQQQQQPQIRCVTNVATMPSESPSSSTVTASTPSSARNRRGLTNLRSNNNNNNNNINNNNNNMTTGTMNTSNNFNNMAATSTNQLPSATQAMLTSNYLRTLPILPAPRTPPVGNGAQIPVYNSNLRCTRMPYLPYNYARANTNRNISSAATPASVSNAPTATFNVNFPLPQQPQQSTGGSSSRMTNIRNTRTRHQLNNSNILHGPITKSLHSGGLLRMPMKTTSHNPDAANTQM